MLREMTYIKLTIKLKALEESYLPGYHGSMLRGVIGTYLRKIHCKKGADVACEGCDIQQQCGYNILFNGVNKEKDGLVKSIKASNPFIVEPLQINKRVYKKGEDLLFNLILLGSSAVRNTHQYIESFQLLSENGLGKNHYTFELIQVRDTILDEEITDYLNPEKYRGYQINYPQAPKDSYLMIDFLTPTRIKEKSKFVSQPVFEVLMKNVLRKGKIYSELFEYSYDYDYRELIEAAKDIEVVSTDTYWKQLERHSSRKNKQLSIGGFGGKVIYKGDFVQFHKWIHLMTIIHIGKNTTTGGGRIRYQYMAEL